MRETKIELRIIDLMRNYRAIRKRTFGKSIPPVEVVGFVIVPEPLMTKLCCGEAHGFSYSPSDWSFSAMIGICEDCNETEVRETLLHEMAHLKVNFKWKRNMGHGKYFKSEARRIMAAGELDDWF